MTENSKLITQNSKLQFKIQNSNYFTHFALTFKLTLLQIYQPVNDTKQEYPKRNS